MEERRILFFALLILLVAAFALTSTSDYNDITGTYAVQQQRTYGDCDPGEVICSYSDMIFCVWDSRSGRYVFDFPNPVKPEGGYVCQLSNTRWPTPDTEIDSSNTRTQKVRSFSFSFLDR